MACSSLNEFVVTLKSNQKIQWIGEDYRDPIFYVPDGAENALKNIRTGEDLAQFAFLCINDDIGDEETSKMIYEERCSQLDKQLHSIGSIEEVSTLNISWGVYYPDNGAPEDECHGGSLAYDFTTGSIKVSREPDPEFVDEMVDIYGDLFQEE